MTDIDSRPTVVNITHYAGDTLTLHVTVPAEVVGTRVFKAQVRARPNSPRLDADFEVTATETGADIVLKTADSQELARRGKFTGNWDVQLQPANGTDPITTLAYGEITIYPDVTRGST